MPMPKKPRANCLYCFAETKTPKTVYCSNQHQKLHQSKVKIKSGQYVAIQALKNYLKNEVGAFCQICNNDMWLGKEILLIIDHVDGNSENNKISNLRLICSNCNATLPTYKSRNRGNGRYARKMRYSNGQSS